MMTYLIVDPQTFILAEDADSETVRQFLNSLGHWARTARDYDVTFGITHECAEALRSTPGSAFNIYSIRQLAQRVPNLSEMDILKVVEPLFEYLNASTYLDDMLAALQTEQHTYELGKILLVPKEHQDRLVSEWLQATFARMIGLVVFARKQDIVPLAALGDVRLLSRYTREEMRLWADAMGFRLLVHVWFDVVVNTTLPDHAAWNDIHEINDELAILYSPEVVSDLQPRRRLKTIIEAVHAACNRYPDHLIATARTEQAARHSNYAPEAVYEELCALIDVWLPAFQRGGIKAANTAYYHERRRKISTESEPTNQDWRIREERIAHYNGQDYYCELHVKLGGSPDGQARIYFKPLNDKIILAGVGQHARTAHDHT